MSINIKKGLFLFSTFMLSITAPSFAEITNMQINAETSINMKGNNATINSNILYGNDKVRMENEISGNKNIPANMGKSIMIFDTKKRVGYMMTPQVKSAIKMDMEQLEKMQSKMGSASPNLNLSMMSDPGKMKEEFKKRGAKMVGAETVLGYLCDIWQMSENMPLSQGGKIENVSMKFWLSHKLNIPLKMEMASASQGKFLSMKTTSIKTDLKTSASSFEVPKDYKVTDMQQMLNQAMNQMKNNKQIQGK
jgi:hypothetical protein